MPDNLSALRVCDCNNDIRGADLPAVHDRLAVNHEKSEALRIGSYHNVPAAPAFDNARSPASIQEEDSLAFLIEHAFDGLA